ncbi:hypothetical protein ACLOJK_024895 [Asimina triloba]
MEEGNRGVVHREVGPTPFLPSSSSSAAAASSNMAFLSRRILREPPVLESEAATHELLEERSIGWGYSRPVVILDVVWNMAFVAVSAVVVGSTLRERPSRPLRAWLSGYALQCVLHVVFVVAEYRRRIRARRMVEEELLLLAQAR